MNLIRFLTLFLAVTLGLSAATTNVGTPIPSLPATNRANPQDLLVLESRTVGTNSRTTKITVTNFADSLTNYGFSKGASGGTAVSNANTTGTQLFTNSSIKRLTSPDASVTITDNGLSVAITAPTNGGITAATTTNIVDGLLFTPGIAYVRTNGNNANAVVGYPSKPFATITNALNALPSDGGVVDLGKSVFSRITQAFMKDNVTFIGEQTPQFHTNNLYLTNGTVIQGPFNFTNNNIALIRLGVDSGPNVVTNVYGGTPQDAIIVGSSPTAAQRFMVRDVVSLGNGSAANAVHLLSFEGNDNMSVQGFEGRGGHHGLVIKSSGANVSDVVIRGAFAEGVFIKSGNNTGQRAANINLNNIRVESMSAIVNDTGDAFRMEANQGIEIVNVNVNNFMSTNTQNGVYMLAINTGSGGPATNRISNVSFNNLNITVRTNGYAFLSQGSVRNVKVNNTVLQGGINGVNVGAFWGGDQPDNFQFSNVRQSGATNGWVIAFGLTNRFLMESVLVQSNFNYGVWPNPADGLNHGIYANNVRSEYNGGANYVTPIRQIDWSGNGMDTFATNANFYSLAILSTGSGSGLHTTDRSDQTKDYAWYANNGVFRLNTPAGGDWLLITNGTVNNGGLSYGDQIFANGFITRSSVGGYRFADRTTAANYGQLYADNDYARLFGSVLSGVLFESKLDGTTNWFKGNVGTDGDFSAAGNVRGVQLSATGSMTNNGQTYFPNMATLTTPSNAVGWDAINGKLVLFPVPTGGSASSNFTTIASGSGTFGSLVVTGAFDAGTLTTTNLVVTNLPGTGPIAAVDSNGAFYRTNTVGAITNISSEEILPSDYTCTIVMTNTGLSVSLPSSGTYLISASVRSTVLLQETAVDAFIVTQLFNSTAGAMVANSERLTMYHNVTNSLGGTRTIQSTAGFGYIASVGSASVFQLQAKKSGTGSTNVCNISSDGNGRTVLSYVKLQ